jgi:hypothetical protein
MTAAQFNRLNIIDQESLIYLEGEFIAARQEPEFIVRLFQFDSFYVEFYYHQVKDSPVSAISFTDVEKLEPYLDSIDLSDLLEDK